MEPKPCVSFKVNGVAHSVRSEDLDTIHMSLAEYLREKALLKGTKVGCGQGGCGACTVVVERPALTQIQQRGAPEAVTPGSHSHTTTTNACLTPILSMEGANVTTVEGVGDVKQPHAIQNRISKLHGTQCGFCTPGMVMSMYGLLKQKQCPTSREVEGAIEGNLCRCTGYRPILDTAKSFAIDIEDVIPSNDIAYPSVAGGTSSATAGGEGEEEGFVSQNATPAPPAKSTVLDDPSRFPKLSAKGRERVVATSKKTIRQIDKDIPYYPELDNKGGAGADSTGPRAPQVASTASDPATAGGGGVGSPADLGANFGKAIPIYGKDGSCWICPKTLAELHDAMSSFPDAKLVGGNYGYKSVLDSRTKPALETSPAGGAGVASSGVTKVDVPAPGSVHSTTATITQISERMAVTTAIPVIWLQQVKELSTITLEEGEYNLRVGAAITMTQAMNKIKTILGSTLAKSKSAWFRNAFEELHDAIAGIGSPQGRNASTLVGHVLTRPAGDATPLLAAMKAEVLISNPNREARRVPVREMCAASGCLMPGDVAMELFIPIGSAERYVGLSKAALRNKFCHASVGVAISFNVKMRDGASIAEDVELFCCGASYFLLPLPEASRVIHGTSLNRHFSNALHTASQSLLMAIRNEMHLPPDGRQPYRIAVARGLLYRLFHKARLVCFPSDAHKLLQEDTGLLRGSQVTQVVPTSATQSWEATTGNIHTGQDHQVREELDQLHRSPVGDPKMIMSGLEQATGQAIYVDDVPTPAGCLHGALVKSTIAKGKIIRIDTKQASATPGYVAYFDYGDVPVKAPVSATKEHAFCDKEVSYVGDVIGLVVATSQLAADKAARLVDVKYEVLKPCFTIEDAIAENSYIPFDHKIVDGDVDGVFSNPKNTVIRGVLNTGGQEHYYMEPHALLVVPGENEDIDIISMTQCVTKSQNLVATTLGVPASKVNVRVRRMGGAFGGKEVRTTYTSATLAVAAVKLKRPIRWLINREEDMRITGGRHPIRSEWAVAFNKDDMKIHGIDVQMYANGGCTDSATSEITNRALMHITNAYKIPAVRVQAKLCLTNIVSNTAYRGFGAPQAMLIMETMMEAVAKSLQLPVESLQRSHLIKVSEKLHYGQNLAHCRLSEMWARITDSSSFAGRAGEVEKFNAANRWIKRGIAITPTLYGINFPVRYLNYGGALVTVYADGSCSLAHSAVEMGQGVNTKCCQVAARTLGIPTTKVNVAETSSEKVPNAPPTAASMGADLACAAVLDACERIMARLRPLVRDHPQGTPFSTIAAAAVKQRICLAAEGTYKTAKGAQYDWAMQTEDNSKRGQVFNYHTFGVGVSEIELDVLTGMWRCVRSDLLMDCGDTLNATIDIGQVEGAFLQGMGWLTMEELQYGDSAHPEIPQNGELWNAGPYNYKVPQANDVPVDFRVELLSGAPNPFAVHGSKAVGEPPLFLSASVFAAIKKAIYAARSDEGMSTFHLVDAPLTNERIRMACDDAHTLGTFAGDDYKAPGSF